MVPAGDIHVTENFVSDVLEFWLLYKTKPRRSW